MQRRPRPHPRNVPPLLKRPPLALPSGELARAIERKMAVWNGNPRRFVGARLEEAIPGKSERKGPPAQGRAPLIVHSASFCPSAPPEQPPVFFSDFSPRILGRCSTLLACFPEENQLSTVSEVTVGPKVASLSTFEENLASFLKRGTEGARTPRLIALVFQIQAPRSLDCHSRFFLDHVPRRQRMPCSDLRRCGVSGWCGLGLGPLARPRPNLGLGLASGAKVLCL